MEEAAHGVEICGGVCRGGANNGTLISISVAARSDVVDVENFYSVFTARLDDGTVDSGAEAELSGKFP